MERRFADRSGVLASLIAAALLMPTLTVAQESPDFYLLDLEADGYRLAESVPAYVSGDTYLIDFALFLEAVEFPIERKGQLWSGWSRSEDRHFLWRMDSEIVQVEGRDDERVKFREWLDAEDGIYVSAEALERWFNLELDVDPRLQTLTIASSEPLPFQIWRERVLAKYRFRPRQSLDADVIVPDQYNWVTMPLFNLSSQFSAQNQDGEYDVAGSASLAMGMDLLKHSFVYAGGIARNRRTQGNSTNRLTIERASATPDTPLFAGINRYILGDIYQANANLVMNSNTGRGFSIDRYPMGRTGNLSQVTIAGDGPPGWEVELYRNGTLIEFATVGSDGRYFFPDEENTFGENTFVAKLFGPQGQIREDRQTFWGGGAELAEGDYDFSISHIDFDQHLLDGAPDNFDGLAADYTTDFRYTRALTGDLQLGAAYTRTGLGTRARDGTFIDSEYVSLFGRMKLGRGVLIGEAVNQLDFGDAWSLEYLTEFNGHKMSVARRVFNDYKSPATIHREEVDAFNELILSGSLGGNRPSGYSLRFRHRELAGGSSDFRVFNRLSWSLGHISLTNDLEHIVNSGSMTTGKFKFASRVKRVSLRGQFDYQFTGDRPLKQVSATMNWDMTRRLNNNLTVTKNLTNDGGLYFTNLLSIAVRDWSLTLSVSSDLDHGWSVGAGLNIAFGYNTRRQSFITDRRGLASTGRATMNLFIDNNNNGIRDLGEPPVSWARYRDQEMLQPGALPLTALPNAQSVQIETRHFKFDDPFLVPRAQAYELRTHTGSDVSFDIAVVMTGDIEGYVFIGSTDEAVAARGIVVSLHDAKGREIARTRSEFDGYYSFTGVPGGDYDVRVSANGDRSEFQQPFSFDAQDGYVVLDGIYIYK